MQHNQNIEYALNQYEIFRNEYRALLSTAEEDLGNIQGVDIISNIDDELILEILGQKITLKFHMVLEEPKDPNSLIGQITASYSKASENGNTIKHPVLYRWFDSLGNVRGETIFDHSHFHLAQNKYLQKFILIVINRLLSSELMHPGNNG